jgi:apolipoprotein N-acyltransferase
MRIEAGRLAPFAGAAASALLLIFAFPRPGAGALAAVALVPLLLAVSGQGRARAFLLGWLCGFAWFAVSLSWLAETIRLYGAIPVPLNLLLIALGVAVLALATGLFALVAREAASLPSRRAIPLVAGGWALIEMARCAFPLPFPWLQLGAAFSGVPPARPLLGVIGVSGVTLFAAASNALLWRAVVKWRSGCRRRAFLLVLLGGAAALAAGAGALAVRSSPADQATLRVGVAQGNFSQAELWDVANRARIVDTYLSLTREAAARGAKLVVWPESALPFYYQDEPQQAGRIRSLARELAVDLVFGGVSREAAGGRPVLRVSAFHVSPGGPPGGYDERYDKTRLVPFGEYVPFRKLLFFVDKLVGEVGDFTPGRWEGPFSTPVPGGALVCYEVAFSDIPRREAAGGARILLNLTNDAWYGTSWGPYQHLAFAGLRAAETGVPLLRAANTGISAVYDAGGKELSRLGLDRRGVIVEDVPVGAAPAPYVWWGDGPVALFALSLVLIAGFPLVANLRRRRSPS